MINTYQTHITLQNVEELREFINTGISDKLTDAGLTGTIGQDLIADDPRIKFQLENQIAAMSVLGLVKAAMGVVGNAVYKEAAW